MEKIIELIITNWELSSVLGLGLIGLIDYLVRKSKNTIDDTIWDFVKSPIVNFVKGYLEDKKIKKEEKKLKDLKEEL